MFHLHLFAEYLSLNSGITQNAVLSPFLLPFYILSQDHLICYCNFNYHLHTDDSQKYIISPTVMTPDTYEYPITYLLYITRHKLNLSINFSQTYSFGILPISNWPHQPPSCLHQKSYHNQKLLPLSNQHPHLNQSPHPQNITLVQATIITHQDHGNSFVTGLPTFSPTNQSRSNVSKNPQILKSK